jgi:putative SOS response-associated peptidase YedK
VAGLIGLSAADIDVQDAMGAIRWKYDGEWKPRPVVRLTTSIPVAVKEGGERVVVRARWGFDVGQGRPIGNARDDKLLESRMWAPLLKTPCLVAATAVYEQVRGGKEKTDYVFRRVDGRPIVMPGLSGLRKVKGEERLCAAIVTTEPNRFFKQFHMRQVCTLSKAEADQWMDESTPELRVDLLHAPADDEWEAVPIEGAFARGIINEGDVKEVGAPLRWAGEA